MSNYQEAKEQEESSFSLGQAKKKSKPQAATLCPACSAPIEEGALFCAECGYNLNMRCCPECGAQTNPGADICSVCKTWLLDGQCTFCYTALDPQAGFCPECGNPKDGIKCPDCGNQSVFDFCTKCGKGLTEGAQAALDLAETDPDAKMLVESKVQVASIAEEIAKLEELIKDAPVITITEEPPKPKEGRFSASKMAALLKNEQNINAAALRKAEEEKNAADLAKSIADKDKQEKVLQAIAQKQELERQKQKAIADAQAALESFRSKQFLTHQDARRFFNARKPPNPSGWLCNFTNTVHTDGPNGCDEPCHGGYWYTGETITVERKGPS